MNPAITLEHFAALQRANAGYWFDPDGILHGDRVVVSLIPENGTQPVIRPRSLILHSNAGSTPATWRNLWAWITRQGDDGGEPHFDIDNTGTCAQFMSIHRRADCNAKANSWRSPSGELVGAVSIETGDLGAATLATTGWNLDQLGPEIGIATGLVIQEGIACTVPTRWDDTGIGHHCLFPEWSIYKGKTCPGAQRIRQMDFIRGAVANRVADYHTQCAAAGIDPVIGWR